MEKVTPKQHNQKSSLVQGKSQPYQMLVIRHAESEWNAFSSKMKAQGKNETQEIHRQDYEPKSLSKDPPITEKGVL